MFKNIGKVFKTIAYIAYFGCIFVTIYISILNPIDNAIINQYKGTVIFGVAIVLLIPCGFLYGFGEIIDRLQNIDEGFDEILIKSRNGDILDYSGIKRTAQEEKERERKLLAEGGWKCTCGRVNYYFLDDCKCGRKRPKNDA